MIDERDRSALKLSVKFALVTDSDSDFNDTAARPDASGLVTGCGVCVMAEAALT